MKYDIPCDKEVSIINNLSDERMEQGMKIVVEIDETLPEEEVIIRCNSPTAETQVLLDAIRRAVSSSEKFAVYKEEREYFIPLDDILFFETESGLLQVHTRDNTYGIHYKLYELEDILPGNFMRVSKSTILNTRHIHSISKNLASSSLVQFTGTHKQVYVSRYYYKLLKQHLEKKSGG